jgi:hypothetical protein
LHWSPAPGLIIGATGAEKQASSIWSGIWAKFGGSWVVRRLVLMVKRKLTPWADNIFSAYGRKLHLMRIVLDVDPCLSRCGPAVQI